MARIVLDPDDVNQAAHVTVTDGTTIDLAEADATTLRQVLEQLRVHKSTYAHALDDPAVGDRVAAGELDVADHSPLYAAVHKRLAAARRQRERQPDDIDPSMLLQRRTWTSSSGTTRLLVELTPSHRHNLVKWLERNSDVLHAQAAADWSNEQLAAIDAHGPWVAGTPLYQRLQELVGDETGHDLARDRAREIARRLEFERTGKWPDQ